MPHRLLFKLTRKTRGVTLVELLIAAVISGIIISAMIGAFVTTASKSVKERRLGEIQEENHLALDLISSEIQEAAWISKDSGKLLELPNGRVVLSLLLPASQGYTLVLYALAAPSENLSPVLQAYLAKNQSAVALYRWQSIPLDVDPKDPIFPKKVAPAPHQPQLVTAFLRSSSEAGNESAISFVEDQNEGEISGGELILRGDNPSQPCADIDSGTSCPNLEIATRAYSRNIQTK
jgi:prepilin-type N-terminal cleavage/methylation domain-containing protein